MGKSAWRAYTGVQKPSSEYLANEIHNIVTAPFLNNFNGDFSKDIQDAARLQSILYALKNYSRQQIVNNEIFSDLEYDLFIQSYGKVTTSNGRYNFQKSFLKRQGGKTLETTLAKISAALVRSNDIISGNKAKTWSQNKKYVGSLIIGGNYNKLDLPLEEVASGTVQNILKDCSLGTTKWFYQNGKKGKNSSKREIVYVQPKQSKIDVYTNSIEVSQTFIAEYPKLAEFAKLYSDSTITAKNYSKSFYQENGIKLGDTNLFTILYDTLTYHNFFDKKSMFSFMYAIFNRKNGRLVQADSSPEDNNIQSHFNHMQTIFELTGIGQNYNIRVNKNQYELNELNDLFQQGARFLIYNEWDTDVVIVQSTRQILQKRLRSVLQNQRFNFYRF